MSGYHPQYPPPSKHQHSQRHTGFIKRVMGKGTFCFIRRADGVELFAHQRDFLDPKHMAVGQHVQFSIVENGIPGKNDAAIDIEAVGLLVADKKHKAA